ncbi:hypothetical protein [Nocardioides sambongensis]|uniref:hypothetical protein n=1 Tax=Nocardioides sambongensis TaxID=2589074 RepID=UPI00112DB0A9|nr:hypothetical protein [Nocardioides sambongensis]
MSPTSFPPPGAPPPEDDGPTPQPTYIPPPGIAPPGHPVPPGLPTAPPAPGMLGAAHRPGAVPLRPLTLGSMYDGAFRIIRYNPKATVGAAALVTAIGMSVPIVLSLLFTLTLGTGLDAGGSPEDDLSAGEAIGLLGSVGALLLGLYATQLGLIFVTGMVAHVTRAAALGRRMSLGEAWAATHGKRWRLIGLSLLVGLGGLLLISLLVVPVVLVAVLTGEVLATVGLAVVVGVAMVCLFGWLWIKLTYLTSAILMLEDGGVFRALGRSWRITGRHYWRTLGIALLTMLITSIAAGILTTPISLAGQIGTVLAPEYVFVILAATQALASVIQNAFVTPFAGAVSSLQYLDLRIRKEGYDVELMRQAGLLPR